MKISFSNNDMTKAIVIVGRLWWKRWATFERVSGAGVDDKPTWFNTATSKTSFHSFYIEEARTAAMYKLMDSEGWAPMRTLIPSAKLVTYRGRHEKA